MSLARKNGRSVGQEPSVLCSEMFSKQAIIQDSSYGGRGVRSLGTIGWAGERRSNLNSKVLHYPQGIR